MVERNPTNTDESSAAEFVDLSNVPSMDELLQEKETQSLAEGRVVPGRVLRKRDDGALVDIGYKAEGFVPKEEFSDWENLQEGQEVDVYVELVEDEDNMPLISVRRAEQQKAWDHLLANYGEGSVVKGVIKRRVKGGLIVDVGVDAFLPGSQVDVGPVRNLEDYLGMEAEFKILKINAARKNIVVSRRELVEEQRAMQRARLLEEIKPGEIRKGTVKNITDFGAFIDLGGMDGLLHVTDMSWGRVSHPSEVVKVGEEIEVMVLDVDRERERISLGLKQKEGDPWDTIEVKYPPGARVRGRVVNVLPYGAFVEIEEGIEGLVHVSEMSWTRRVHKASEVVSPGDEVDVVVLDINKQDRRISLSIRQAAENPWEKLAQQFPPGSKIKGKVRNMTSYGAFVQIQDDIDGMIHVSDMSWTRKVNHPSEVLEKGQEVEVVVLDIDPVNQRISLGLKQLTEDPWTDIERYYHVGDIVEGVVTKVTGFGAFVELEHGIEGLIHISQMSDEHIENAADVVKEGDKVRARVIKISPEERRIGLSLTAADEEFQPAPEEAGGAPVSAGQELVSIGHIMDSAMAQVEEDAGTESQTPPADQEEAPPAADAAAEEAAGEESSAEPADEKTEQETPAHEDDAGAQENTGAVSDEEGSEKPADD